MDGRTVLDGAVLDPQAGGSLADGVLPNGGDTPA